MGPVYAPHTARPPAGAVQRNRVSVTRLREPAGADQPTVCALHTARPPAATADPGLPEAYGAASAVRTRGTDSDSTAATAHSPPAASQAEV
jgi:hypothetical protein